MYWVSLYTGKQRYLKYKGRENVLVTRSFHCKRVCWMVFIAVHPTSSSFGSSPGFKELVLISFLLPASSNPTIHWISITTDWVFKVTCCLWIRCSSWYLLHKPGAGLWKNTGASVLSGSPKDAEIASCLLPYPICLLNWFSLIVVLMFLSLWVQHAYVFPEWLDFRFLDCFPDLIQS